MIRFTPAITSAHATAWEQRKLDQRCNECGWTQAASSWCPACQSRNIEYRSHAEQQAAGQSSAWCGGSLRGGNSTALADYRAKYVDDLAGPAA